MKKTKNQTLPSLSVVVPVYNEKDQLHQCLTSLEAQIDDIQEVIIVNNNSTDGSDAIAGEFARRQPKMRVVTQTIQGLVPTRNLGFRQAKSDAVARIDADSQVLPGWAQAIRKTFAAHPEVAALYGDTRYHDIPFERFTTTISAFFVDVSNRFSSGSPSLYGPNMALRKSVAARLADEACDVSHIMEDLDLTIHLRKNRQQIRFCKQMSCYISGRRLSSWPIHYWSYCIMWPRTYALHSMYVAAAISGVVAFIGCFFQILIFFPLRCFNPKTRRFSLAALMSKPEDRIIP